MERSSGGVKAIHTATRAPHTGGLVATFVASQTTTVEHTSVQMAVAVAAVVAAVAEAAAPLAAVVSPILPVLLVAVVDEVAATLQTREVT